MIPPHRLPVEREYQHIIQDSQVPPVDHFIIVTADDRLVFFGGDTVFSFLTLLHNYHLGSRLRGGLPYWLSYNPLDILRREKLRKDVIPSARPRNDSSAPDSLAGPQRVAAFPAEEPPWRPALSYS